MTSEETLSSEVQKLWHITLSPHNYTKEQNKIRIVIKRGRELSNTFPPLQRVMFHYSRSVLIDRPSDIVENATQYFILS